MSQKALAILWERADGVFFREHADRCYHIRNAYEGECQGEFWSLGPHPENRRRVILCRVDFQQKPLPDNKVLKIPFVAFADEQIEDTDDCLFSIVRDFMLEALKKETVR